MGWQAVSLRDGKAKHNHMVGSLTSTITCITAKAPVHAALRLLPLLRLSRPRPITTTATARPFPWSRRIVAVTGDEAEAAIALADQLAEQVAAAGKLAPAEMAAEVKALSQSVSGGCMWCGFRCGQGLVGCVFLSTWLGAVLLVLRFLTCADLCCCARVCWLRARL
jgi:hypothetical protein